MQIIPTLEGSPKRRLLFLFCFLCTTVLCAREVPRHRTYKWHHLELEDMQGDIRIPVVFIGFEEDNGDNEKVVSSGNQTTWMGRLNTSNPVNHMKADGSVNDYFLAQSYGRTNVTFERVGEYVAPGKAADYAESSRSRVMARDAVQSLEGVDWSRYDCNGDKEVDCVLLIYAGHADGDYDSRSKVVKSIYPHQNWVSNNGSNMARLGTDGYMMERYVFCQSMRDRSTSLAAINTVCHELSHGIFDLCDYYRNLYSYMGQFDAMCFGYRQTSYGSQNDHCCDYTSFNRMYLGWLTPRELSGKEHVTLRPLSEAPEACIVSDPKDPRHFFLLENRAKMAHSWDANLPAGGLVLTEVHYLPQTFESHSVNSGGVPNIQVIEAASGKGLKLHNDQYYQTSQAGVPYGLDGRTEIQESVSGLFATQRITNIRVNDDLSVEFDYENLDADGIDIVKNEDAGQPVFDLTGRKVGETTRGMYIRGGRKYVRR